MIIYIIVGIIFISLGLINLIFYYKYPHNQTNTLVRKIYTVVILIFGFYLVLSNLIYL